MASTRVLRSQATPKKVGKDVAGSPAIVDKVPDEAEVDLDDINDMIWGLTPQQMIDGFVIGGGLDIGYVAMKLRGIKCASWEEVDALEKMDRRFRECLSEAERMLSEAKKKQAVKSADGMGPIESFTYNELHTLYKHKMVVADKAMETAREAYKKAVDVHTQQVKSASQLIEVWKEPLKAARAAEDVGYPGYYMDISALSAMGPATAPAQMERIKTQMAAHKVAARKAAHPTPQQLLAHVNKLAPFNIPNYNQLVAKVAAIPQGAAPGEY